MNFLKSIYYYFGVFHSYLGKRLYIVFILSGMGALAEGLGIALILPLLQAADSGELGGGVIDGRLQRMIFGTVEFLGLRDSLVGIFLLIGGIFIAKGLLKFCEVGYKGYLQTQLLRELKERLFSSYSQMSYHYYVQHSTGRFLNILNSQINRLYAAFQNFTGFLAHVVTSALYIAFATLLAWRFAVFALVVGFVVLFLFKWLNEYVRKLSRKVAEEMGVLNGLLVQVLQGFKYVAATGQTHRFRVNVLRSIRRYTRYQFYQSVASAFTQSVREPLAIFLILGIVVVQVVVLGDPLGPILVSLILFYRSFRHIVGIQTGWQGTMEKIASLEMVEEEFEATARWRETNGRRELGPLTEGIEFRNVFFHYETGTDKVLENVSLNIRANTTVAFVGESGAGKSTLIDMLTLMLRPKSGEILIDGVPGEEISLQSWRSQIGYVSQDVVVFDDTVANNICLWAGDYKRDPEIRECVHDAAMRAYAHHFIEDLPEQYQTLVGDRGVRLSGGQRQRLFIARELYKNPRLLIMDEATSALDSESERAIQKSVELLKGKCTVVLIAHRLSTIKNADYIFVLDKGRVIEEGTYADLAGRETLFQRMVELQKL